jgi:hypothetical protein
LVEETEVCEKVSILPCGKRVGDYAFWTALQAIE